MNSTLLGLIVGSTVVSIGCAQTIARHDLFERSDARVARAIESARRTCQDRQPTDTEISAAEYQQCVWARLHATELTVARH